MEQTQLRRNPDYCREYPGFLCVLRLQSNPHLPELPDWLRAPIPPPSHGIHSGLSWRGGDESLTALWSALESLTRGVFGLRRPDLRRAGESGSGISINLRGGAGNEPRWHGGEFIEGIVPAITA